MNSTADRCVDAVDGGARPTAISLRNVSKKFAQSVALQDISFEVKDGEFLVLLGPSGCGKTTLLRMIAGLLPATDGSIELTNRLLASADTQPHGFVFQEDNLLPWRNAWRNVALALEATRAGTKQERRAKAYDQLGLVGLGGFEKHMPYELSGGMRQRVSIARALVHDPPLLLMDEPFGALDAQTRDQMNLDLQNIWLQKRKTAVLVTHSIAEAVFLADRIVLLGSHPGRMISISQVPFERPRKLSLLHDPAFTAMVSELRTAIAGAGGRDPMSEVDND